MNEQPTGPDTAQPTSHADALHRAVKATAKVVNPAAAVRDAAAPRRADVPLRRPA